MFFYFFIFVILLLQYNLYRTTNNKIAFVACFILPVSLAYCRDLQDFGKDINLYAIPTFLQAGDFSNFITFWIWNGNEIGYCALNWIVSRFTDDVRFYLGFHQFVVFLFIMLTAENIKSKKDSLFFLAFYLLCFFNLSIVMFRQILSISVIMFITARYLSGHKKSFWAGLVFAQLFHNASIIAGVIPVLIWAVEKYHKHFKKICLLIIAFISILYIGFKTIFFQLALSVSDKYDNYFSQDDMKTHKVDLIVWIGLLLCTLLSGAKTNKEKIGRDTVRAFTILYIGILMLGDLFETANRLSFNIMAPIILLLPQLFTTSVQRKKAFTVIFALLLSAYVFNSITEGISLTVPYKSKLLGIG